MPAPSPVPAPPPAYPVAPPAILSIASALYAYSPTDAGDLALQPNDQIQVLEHMNNDCEWSYPHQVYLSRVLHLLTMSFQGGAAEMNEPAKKAYSPDLMSTSSKTNHHTRHQEHMETCHYKSPKVPDSPENPSASLKNMARNSARRWAMLLSSELELLSEAILSMVFSKRLSIEIGMHLCVHLQVEHI